MADEGFDLCECIWNHEFAMQRLLSILRQSQNYCTDNECFDMSRLPGPRDVPSWNLNFFMILLIIVFVVLMYALRPQSLRHLNNDIAKDRNNERDSHDDPPVPPPTIQ
ncbi:small integral membrane protein 14 [Apis laboriosa]|uniref:small integral membrane protein 14 n=1 Tax=Apis laboriosa TaxID=183418 RepID=UPI001CC49AA1|nr:small integral membrane protein 14 [Apis laboriosa]